MANVKISELPAADPIDGTELVPVVQAGVTRRSTFARFPLSDDVDSIVTLTQAAYDLIAVPDPRTLYVIVG